MENTMVTTNGKDEANPKNSKKSTGPSTARQNRDDLGRWRKGSTGLPSSCRHGSHGQRALESTLSALATESDWLEDLGEVGAAARELRDQLVQDQGGEGAVGETRRLLTEQVVRKWILIESGYRYLLGQGGGPIDKRRRQLRPLVIQLDRLDSSLSRDLQALGLERRPKPAPSLEEYIASRQAETEAAEETVDS